MLRKKICHGYERYYEPFAGAACLLFELEQKKSVLSDFNDSLVNFYTVLAHQVLEFYGFLTKLEVGREAYYHVRSMDLHGLPQFQKAAIFYYLNRFCFNGIYRTNKAGRFNVPYGSRTSPIPDLSYFMRYSEYLKHVDIRWADYKDATADVRANDFVYMDPPYRSNEKQFYGEYGYGCFRDSDLEQFSAVANDLSSRGAHVLISYRDSVRVRELFDGWHIELAQVRYKIAANVEQRQKANELLISNYA